MFFRRRKELEEALKLQRLQAADEKYSKAHRQFRACLRVQPLGTDRNHSRYFVFGKYVPGLFVEKASFKKKIQKSIQKIIIK